MGDGHQGCNEEVPEPNEPKCDWCGRSGAQPRWRRPSAQPQTPQHRVGPPSHRASGQSDRNIGFVSLPAALRHVALFSCANKDLFDLFLDPGDQSDGDLCEGTLYSRPRGEEDGAVFNKRAHLVAAHISMAVDGAVVPRWALAISTVPARGFSLLRNWFSFRLLSPTGFQWMRGLFTGHTPTTPRCKYRRRHCTHLSTLASYPLPPACPQHRPDPGGHHHCQGREPEQLPGGDDGQENVR